MSTFDLLDQPVFTSRARRGGGDDRFGFGGGPPPAAGRDEEKSARVSAYERGRPTAFEGLPDRLRGEVSRSVVGQQGRIRYYDGDEYSGRSMSPAKIFETQQLLGSIGLLTTRFTPRVWDETTAKAWRSVLEYANQNDLTDQEAARQLAIQVDQAGGLADVDEFGNILIGDQIINDRPPLIVRHQPTEDLKRVFRRLTTDELGIGASEDELNAYIGAYRKVETERQYQAYALEQEGGSVVDVPSPEAFASERLIEEQPRELEEGRAVNLLGDFMGLLNAPAWQGGQVGQFTGI